MSTSSTSWGAPLASALATLRRERARRQFLEALALATPLSLFAAGGCILLARFVGHQPLPDALWGLGLVALAPAFAVWKARRGRLDARALAVELDARAGGTGVLVTQFELGDERWAPQVAQVCARPREAVGEPELGNGMWGSLFGLLFVGTVFLFQPVDPAPTMPLGMLTGKLAQIAGALEELDGLGGLEPRMREQFEERLSEIEASMERGGLEEAFESMDRFRDELERLAGEHAGTLADLREFAEGMAGGRNEELIAALEGALGDPAAQRLLQETLQQLGADFDPASMQDLSSLLESLGKNQDLAALSGAMSEAFAKRLAELDASKLVDPRLIAEALAKRAKPRSSKGKQPRHDADCEALHGGMCDGSGECAGAGLLAGNAPGNGGITRGGGGADLAIGEGSALDPALFEAQQIDAAAVPDDSTLLDVQFTTPEVAPAGEAIGVTDVAASGGSVTWKRRLSPTQRDAVRRFFTPNSDSDQ